MGIYFVLHLPRINQSQRTSLFPTTRKRFQSIIKTLSTDGLKANLEKFLASAPDVCLFKLVSSCIHAHFRLDYRSDVYPSVL